MSDTEKRVEEAFSLLREGIQKNDDTVIQSVVTVILETFIAQHVVQTEALMQIARAMTKMSIPPIHVKDIGLSTALMGDMVGTPLTVDQAADLREELFYLFARAWDCGYMAKGYETKPSDCRALAAESVGVINNNLFARKT